MHGSYQNHRRYVQSLDTSQLKGSSRTLSVSELGCLVGMLTIESRRSQINNGDCKPVTSQNGKPYYPCGLIANSVFNGALMS